MLLKSTVDYNIYHWAKSADKQVIFLLFFHENDLIFNVILFS